MKRWIRVQEEKGWVRMQVIAWSCGVPGLFVNRDINDTDKQKWYCITHRLSGLRVGGFWFRRKSDAILVAQVLTDEYDIDWSIKDPNELVRKHFGINQWMEAVVDNNAKGDIRVK